MKAEEELVEVEPQALILMRVDIHVVMIRIVLISIVMNSFDKQIVNQIRTLRSLLQRSWAVLKLELAQVIFLVLEL
jgi:hypothetical protein